MSKSTPEITVTHPNLIAHHEAFSHIRKELKTDSAAQFAAHTMEVSRGIKVCLDLVFLSDMYRREAVDADPDDQLIPTLNLQDTEYLMRLAIISAQELGNKAEDHLARLERKAVKL